jgi:hypothetical protein
MTPRTGRTQDCTHQHARPSPNPCNAGAIQKDIQRAFEMGLGGWCSEAAHDLPLTLLDDVVGAPEQRWEQGQP